MRDISRVICDVAAREHTIETQVRQGLVDMVFSSVKGDHSVVRKLLLQTIRVIAQNRKPDSARTRLVNLQSVVKNGATFGVFLTLLVALGFKDATMQAVRAYRSGPSPRRAKGQRLPPSQYCIKPRIFIDRVLQFCD